MIKNHIYSLWTKSPTSRHLVMSSEVEGSPALHDNWISLDYARDDMIEITGYLKRICALSCLLVALFLAESSAQTPLVPLFPDDVRRHAEQALGALNMTMEDAKFEKDHGKPKWTLAWITNTLSDPWALPGVAEKIETAVESNDAEMLWSLSAELLELTPEEKNWEPTAPNDGLLTLDELTSTFSNVAVAVSENLEQTFAGVDASNRIYLSAFVLSPVFETEDNKISQDLLAAAGIGREFQVRVENDSRLLDTTDISLAWLALVHRIDLAMLHHTAQLFQREIYQFKRQAAEIKEWPTTVMTNETSLGRIIIGTQQDDVFDGSALLILDPGGNDVYRNGAGAANGLLNQPLAAIVDLAGDDEYFAHQLLGPGAALWGISVMLDESGDDVYKSGSIGSAAAVYGASWIEDISGNDFYKGRAIGQGAGIIGFGYQLDHAGDDQYDIGIYGQGFSGVKGWGLLVDRAGNDRYFAGNVQLDHERNDKRYLSLAQGFSTGLRPHAGGGVAALVDLGGNDTYTADIYGQGVSYYYSAGFLLDHDGHDRYSMYQYGQGCGIHLSFGLLADAAGDDFYTGFILAQGAAHDYAVGMLFDHAGNDTYTADHHSQGRALNNAFALLVDRAGDDAYFGRQRGESQGIGNSAGYRDYGSLALLLDLNGCDIYSGGFSNAMSTLRPLYGVVYDHEESKGE